MITITDAALDSLMQVKESKQKEGDLRLFVKGGGCSGLGYGMVFDETVRDGDIEFDNGRLNVLVDPMSLNFLDGCVIDYQDSLLGGGFKIDNPNAVASCGCGSSFRTA